MQVLQAFLSLRQTVWKPGFALVHINMRPTISVLLTPSVRLICKAVQRTIVKCLESVQANVQEAQP